MELVNIHVSIDSIAVLYMVTTNPSGKSNMFLFWITVLLVMPSTVIIITETTFKSCSFHISLMWIPRLEYLFAFKFLSFWDLLLGIYSVSGFFSLVNYQEIRSIVFKSSVCSNLHFIIIIIIIIVNVIIIIIIIIVNIIITLHFWGY